MGRVVVADDDPHHLDMVSTCLGREGFEVAAAPTGALCLDILLSRRVDLLILDLFMPDLDGIELLETARALGIDAPVIGMTAGRGGQFDPYAAAMMARGADIVLRKPFTPSALVAEARRLLNQ